MGMELSLTPFPLHLKIISINQYTEYVGNDKRIKHDDNMTICLPRKYTIHNWFENAVQEQMKWNCVKVAAAKDSIMDTWNISRTCVAVVAVGEWVYSVMAANLTIDLTHNNTESQEPYLRWDT